jgi:hypothetical protein
MIFQHLPCVVDKLRTECFNEHFIELMHIELILVQIFMEDLAVPCVEHIVSIMRDLNDWTNLAFVLA